jgi:hypothetical protein
MSHDKHGPTTTYSLGVDDIEVCLKCGAQYVTGEVCDCPNRTWNDAEKELKESREAEDVLRVKLHAANYKLNERCEDVERAESVSMLERQRYADLCIRLVEKKYGL